MTVEEFKRTIQESNPPDNISQNLLALWLEASGDWNKAHDIVQGTSGFAGDWIHAYLHRKEGDLWNASYWYSRIGKTRPDDSFEQEWETLVRHVIDQQ